MYFELPPPDPLSTHIECLWAFKRDCGTDDQVLRFFPDNCLDLYVNRDTQIWVAGPTTHLREIRPGCSDLLFGLRIRAGSGQPILGVPLPELVHRHVSLGTLCPPARMVMMELLDSGRSEQECLLALAHGFAKSRANWKPRDAVVVAALQEIEAQPPYVDVKSLCELLNIGERRLHRHFIAAVGYGPKRFLRVARFQRLISLVRSESTIPCWADLALIAGYNDQPHMVREIQTFAGVSPTKLFQKNDVMV